MNDFELGYIVGLLEGEGYFCSIRKGIYLTVQMCDLEPVQKLQQICGGNLRPMKAKTSTGKTVYRWTLGRRQNVIELVRLLQPHMSPRRNSQIQAMLDLNSKQTYQGTARHGGRRQWEVLKCRCDICIKAHKNLK